MCNDEQTSLPIEPLGGKGWNGELLGTVTRAGERAGATSEHEAVSLATLPSTSQLYFSASGHNGIVNALARTHFDKSYIGIPSSRPKCLENKG